MAQVSARQLVAAVGMRRRQQPGLVRPATLASRRWLEQDSLDQVVTVIAGHPFVCWPVYRVSVTEPLWQASRLSQLVAQSAMAESPLVSPLLRAPAHSQLVQAHVE